MAAQSPATCQSAPVPNARARHFCKKIADAIAKYLTEEEAREFIVAQLAFARQITHSRYCPGLVDASYAVYATAFNLRKEG